MIGQTISHYKILEKLGGGGMGIVYKAQDLKLDRHVALKFLPPELTRDPEAKTRFIHEAKAASALQHNNICVVYDIDETSEGELFICMEHLDGETLKKRIERGPLKTDEAIDIAIQVAQGLQEAHNHQIVHRDIKPANILVTTSGVAKIVDFGLAKLAGQTLLTKSGSTVGTAAYMSPEQARGEAVDARTDIWSLGVLIYEMVTGQRPFKGEYENATLYAILNAEPELLSGLRTGVPKELERIVTKALAKDLAHRYQHVGDLLVDLNVLKEASHQGATPQFLVKRARIFQRSILTIVAMGIVLGVAAGIWLFGKHEVSALSYERSKSIGVLPFVPMNKTSEDSIFADGIHDDILTQLSKISDLRVIARTSMVLYRDTKKRLSEIGDELDVGYLLEGSVRRAGGRLRITAQLINTKTEGHAWAEVYERNEADVFAIQSEIAARIAEELNIRLSSSEKLSIARPLTSNLAAYDCYVKGQYYWSNYFDKDGNVRAAEMFDSAAHHDPKFIEAHAWASIVHSALYGIATSWDHSPQRLQRSKAALEKAAVLSPDAPEVRLARAMYYRAVEEDNYRALAELEAVLKQRPRWSEALNEIGASYQVLGDLQKAREMMRRRRIVDPVSMSGGWDTFLISARLREWGVAKREAEEYLARHPDDPFAYRWLSDILIDGFGDLTGARKVLEEGTRRPPDTFHGGQYVGKGDFWRTTLYERRYDSALVCASFQRFGWPSSERFVRLGTTLFVRGDINGARSQFDSARAIWEKRMKLGGYSLVWLPARLGYVLAGAGKSEEGIGHLQEAMEASSKGATIDLYTRQDVEEMLATAYIFAGKYSEAINLLDDLLRKPGTVTVWKLRLNPLYDPLRSNARFQKLVARAE